MEVDRLGPLRKIHLLYKQLPYSLCIANASKVNSMPSSILVTPPPQKKNVDHVSAKIKRHGI